MSKKSSTFAPESKKVFFEVCSSVPCAAFKPKEAMSIREMLIRTERGQRLDVHTRFRAEGIPDNMYQMQFDEEGKLLPDLNEDTFDHTPPDGVQDVVDLIRYNEELNERKEELKQRRMQMQEEERKKQQAHPQPQPAPEDNKKKPQATTEEE